MPEYNFFYDIYPKIGLITAFLGIIYSFIFYKPKKNNKIFKHLLLSFILLLILTTGVFLLWSLVPVDPGFESDIPFLTLALGVLFLFGIVGGATGTIGSYIGILLKNRNSSELNVSKKKH